ncbi:MAG TPA: DUF4331 domain-containing protein [Acidimicrobiales bacterium]|jgi:hypothetical protein|nr:DUF4331 domain-containing protein [Acidimicrobiales bacterium]
MSSHKEAPLISKDPVCDSTDVYAFVSPDDPETVTIIANYVPLQDPASGPNFVEFGATSGSSGAGGSGPVQYDINIDNTGGGKPNITYRFLFNVEIIDDSTFLYATGPITTPSRAGANYNNWNRPQTYTIEKIVDGVSTPLAPVGTDTLYCPPCNIGPRSTPNYSNLSGYAVYTLATGEKVFAGQRAEAFFVDLGSIFDLGDLRPLSGLQLLKGTASLGINALADKNVHSIAIQVPISSLTSTLTPPTGPDDPHAVIGVWTTASRQTMKMYNSNGTQTTSGPYQQVSRLGSPLVNEVVVPMALKDFFNSQQPVNDSQFAAAVEKPEMQGLLPYLYPNEFPHLAAYTKARADLVAIFATGIPGSLIGSAFGYGTYQGGKVIAEMLRLNMAIAPTGTNGAGTSNLGLLGGDLAGFPNGRRLTDDVVNIELKAVGGATIPLVDKSYTVDAAVAAVTQGVTANPLAHQASFPYLADPHPGFSNPTGTPSSNDNTSINYTPTS